MATYLKSLPAVDSPKPGVPEPNQTEKVVMLPAKDASSGASRLTALVRPRPRLSAPTRFTRSLDAVLADATRTRRIRRGGQAARRSQADRAVA